MLNNYHYYLVFVEERSVEKASRRLFISHQRLSKYLKDLELHYGKTLYERRPVFRLTPAGELLWEAYKKIEQTEMGARNHIRDLSREKSGYIHFGLTPGRVNFIMPRLLKRFDTLYPHVQVNMTAASSHELMQRLRLNAVELILTERVELPREFVFKKLVTEELFLVISDNLLKKYFPDFPLCRERMKNGVTLREFASVPCVVTSSSYAMVNQLEKGVNSLSSSLNIALEIPDHGLHCLLTAEDLGFSFTVNMDLPKIKALNALKKLRGENNPLNVFPLLEPHVTSDLGVIYPRHLILTEYAQAFISELGAICREKAKNL